MFVKIYAPNDNQNGIIQRNAHVACKTAMRDYQESAQMGRQTHRQTERWMDKQRSDKVFPMCRYALHATQKSATILQL